eukprot:scaffold33853_cov47-Phaeocystis_antarctica.AAC.1
MAVAKEHELQCAPPLNPFLTLTLTPNQGARASVRSTPPPPRRHAAAPPSAPLSSPSTPPPLVQVRRPLRLHLRGRARRERGQAGDDAQGRAGQAVQVVGRQEEDTEVHARVRAEARHRGAARRGAPPRGVR